MTQAYDKLRYFLPLRRLCCVCWSLPPDYKREEMWHNLMTDYGSSAITSPMSCMLFSIPGNEKGRDLTQSCDKLRYFPPLHPLCRIYADLYRLIIKREEMWHNLMTDYGTFTITSPMSCMLFSIPVNEKGRDLTQSYDKLRFFQPLRPHANLYPLGIKREEIWRSRIYILPTITCT